MPPPPLPRSEPEGRTSGSMLADTQRQCQSEFTRGLRNHEWAQVGWCVLLQLVGVLPCLRKEDRTAGSSGAPPM